MKGSQVYLSHILDEIELIKSMTKDLRYEDFVEDKAKEHTITRSLEIIGEASKNISEHLKQKHPEVPWKFMAGLRDKIVHGYFSINYDIVWDVIIHKMPELEPKIKAILDDVSQDS